MEENTLCALHHHHHPSTSPSFISVVVGVVGSLFGMEENTLCAFKQLLLELSEFGDDQFSLDAVAKMHFQLGVLQKLGKVSRCQEHLLSEYFTQKAVKYNLEGPGGGSTGLRQSRGRDGWCSRIGSSPEADLSWPDGSEVAAGRGYEALLERLVARRASSDPLRPGDVPGGTEPPGPVDPERPSPKGVPTFACGETGVPRSARGLQRIAPAGVCPQVPTICRADGTFVSAGDLVAVANVGSTDAHRSGPSVGREAETGSARGRRRSAGSRFVSPVPEQGGETVTRTLKNIEPRMAELIENEIVDGGPRVEWDDIAGLEFAKRCVQEMVVWPLLRPDIFTGLRSPARGLLLFGPPGTGKTLIGKCIASQAGATFFYISASSLTSKWVGEGEKMVRALFAVARSRQPSVVFVDEIDSLLSRRSDSEHESSRRIKTEFLVQLDGAATVAEDRVLVVGATNRPQELDEAARRRLARRLYIPLPDTAARRQILERLLGDVRHRLESRDLDVVAERTAGYSGADVALLCGDAALGPVRELSTEALRSVAAHQVRPVDARDLDRARGRVRPSVSPDDLDVYVRWNSLFGSAPIEDLASHS